MRVGIIHVVFFFSSRRRHTRCSRDWSSDVCSSDLKELRDYSPIPGLWSRIECALIEQDGRKARRPEGKWWFSFLPNVSLGWQTAVAGAFALILTRSEEHTSELQSRLHLVCRLLLENKKSP